MPILSNTRPSPAEITSTAKYILKMHHEKPLKFGTDFTPSSIAAGAGWFFHPETRSETLSGGWMGFLIRTNPPLYQPAPGSSLHRIFEPQM